MTLFAVCPFAAVAEAKVSAAPLYAASAPENGMVRVWLSSLGSPTKLTVTVKGSYTVGGQAAKALPSGASLTVSMDSGTGQITLAHNGASTAMGRSFTLRRHATTGDNGVLIAQSTKPSNPYPGDVQFTAQKQSSGAYRLYAIVSVYIETYLYGVVPYEMGNSAHLEALKAQAVAARTYTLRKMRARASSLYDVTDTTSDQVYYGTPTSGTANCTAAVDATRGVVVMNAGALTGTYYTASNGGQTEASRNVWGGSGYPYLSVKDDPFDVENGDSRVKSATIYGNAAHASQNAKMMALLKTKAVAALKGAGYAATNDNTALLTIGDVTLHTPKYPSPSRLYTRMDVQLSARTVSSSGGGVVASVTVTCGVFTELESLLSLSINSTQNELWTVTKSGSDFVVQARRYGHGVGMSQRGAMQMGKLGYTYAHILAFYYPGCTRTRYTFTHTILSEVSSGGSETVTTAETPAAPSDDDAPAYGTVKLASATDALAVRRSASLSAEAVGMVPHGVPVGVYAQSGGFCFIACGEIRGWVPQEALSLTGDAPASTDLAPSDGVVVGYAKVTCNGTLNLRASGNAKAKVLCTVRNGAVLPVLERAAGWARVQHGALTAWASADFLVITAGYPGAVSDAATRRMVVSTADGTGSVNLRKSASTQAAVVKEVPAGSVVVQTQSDGTWSAVTFGGASGYMMARYLTEAADDAGAGDDGAGDDKPVGGLASGETEAIVASEKSSLNLRQQPSTDSKILLEIPRGESVVVTARGADWCAVRYSGLSGHVMTMYLSFPNDDAATGDPAWVNTVTGSLNLRKAARAGSAILRTIPKGARVDALARGDDWTRVRYAGTVGYVMTSFLRFPDEGADDGVPDDGVPDDGASAPDIPPGVVPTNAPETPDDPAQAGDDDAPEKPVNAPLSESYAPTAALVATPSGSLNLRVSPSDRADVLRKIPRDARVSVDSHGIDWTGVTYRDTSGYVMSKFLKFLDEPPETATDAPDTGDAPDDAPDTGDDDGIDSPLQMWVNTDSGSLNLREKPDGRVLTTIPQFETVDVLSVGDVWSRVRYEGVTGYVMTSFLDGAEAGDPDASTSTPARDAWVYTDAGSLNLRESRSRDAKVVTTIPRLARVRVSDEDGTWAAVTYAGVDGFVMTRYLAFTKPAGAPTPDEDDDAPSPADAPDKAEAFDTSDAPIVPVVPVYGETLTPVTNMIAIVESKLSTLNLRDACSAEDGAVIAEMPRGTQIDVLARGATWCRVSFEQDGAAMEGYCMTAYLFFPNDE